MVYTYIYTYMYIYIYIYTITVLNLSLSLSLSTYTYIYIYICIHHGEDENFLVQVAGYKYLRLYAEAGCSAIRCYIKPNSLLTIIQHHTISCK